MEAEQQQLLTVLGFFFSPQDQIRTKAHQMINDQIQTDPIFVCRIFSIYFNPQLFAYKKISLEVLKLMVSKYFQILQPNIESFLTLLNRVIENTNDFDLFQNLAEIIYQTALNINNRCPFVENCLKLYQTNKTYLPFCLYLFQSVFSDENLQVIYSECLKQTEYDIVMGCIQIKNKDVQFCTIKLFCELTSKYETETEVPGEYRIFVCLLLGLAKQQYISEGENFNNFWDSISNLNCIFSEQFYNFAKKQLFENFPNINSNSKLSLFQFILHHSKMMQNDEVPLIINWHFAIQTEVDEVDQSNKIFTCLQNIDNALTYQIFKQVITQYLTDVNPKKQCIALISLFGFLDYYMPESTNDITPFINIIVRLPIDNEVVVLEQLSFLKHLLDSEMKLDKDDSIEIEIFLIKIISANQNLKIQCNALCVLKNLQQYVSFMDQMINIFPNICTDAIPNYMRCLIHMNLDKETTNSLALPKYDNFLDSILNIFNNSLDKINQIKNMPKFYKNKGLQKQIYNYLLLCGSTANILFFFSFFNPFKLGGSVKQILDSIMEIVDIDDYLCSDESDVMFNILLIEEEFFNTCHNMRPKSIELILPYYNKITKCALDEFFRNTFLEVFGYQFVNLRSTIARFTRVYTELLANTIHLESFLKHVNNNLLYITKWIYKIPSQKMIQIILDYTNRALVSSVNSSNTFEVVCKSMLQLIKPKRVAYNKNNEWYSKVVEEVTKMSFFAVTDILPKIPPPMLNTFFDSFVYLIKIFITLNNPFGHTFFDQVIKSYTLNMGSTERSIMRIFGAMLEKNYCTDQEKQIIQQLSTDILNTNSLYPNSSGDAFLMFYYLAKTDLNVFNVFLPTAVNLFNQSKNDQYQYACRCSYSLFIFSSFVANPEVFNSIAPLIPEILGLFPMEQMTIINLFIDELVKLVNEKLEILNKELIEQIMSCIVKYLSYQLNSWIILKVTEERHHKLHNMLDILTQRYIREFPKFDIVSFAASCLPGHQYSLQYISQLLSLQKQICQ